VIVNKNNISKVDDTFSIHVLPSASYNLLNAAGEPPTGVLPRRMTPSMSKAMANEGLFNNVRSVIEFESNDKIIEELRTVEIGEKMSGKVWKKTRCGYWIGSVDDAML
jgi:hypothetical protein